MRVLDVKALYTSDSDRIDILVWFLDPDTSVAHPEEISDASAQAYIGNIPQTTVWSFNRFNGTGENSVGTGGAIRLFWSKPHEYQNLKIKVSLTDMSGDIYSFVAPVNTGSSDDLIVAPNPDNTPSTVFEAPRIREGASDSDIFEV